MDSVQGFPMVTATNYTPPPIVDHKYYRNIIGELHVQIQSWMQVCNEADEKIKTLVNRLSDDFNMSSQEAEKCLQEKEEASVNLQHGRVMLDAVEKQIETIKAQWQKAIEKENSETRQVAIDTRELRSESKKLEATINGFKERIRSAPATQVMDLRKEAAIWVQKQKELDAGISLREKYLSEVVAMSSGGNSELPFLRSISLSIQKVALEDFDKFKLKAIPLIVEESTYNSQTQFLEISIQRPNQYCEFMATTSKGCFPSILPRFFVNVMAFPVVGINDKRQIKLSLHIDRKSFGQTGQFIVDVAVTSPDQSQQIIRSINC